jgi:hypothetical protein
MLEITLLSFAAWLFFAAASFKFRRQLGITSPATVRALRAGAAALLAVALLRCGTAIDGERCVRFLGGASLAAAMIVALLSVAPVATMKPVALLVRPRRR